MTAHDPLAGGPPSDFTRPSRPGSDLTFITNQVGESLAERFSVLIRDTRFFDALVGYFFSSGFHRIEESLASTERIRILIGLNTDRGIYDLIRSNAERVEAHLANADTEEQFARLTEEELAHSNDTPEVELGVNRFVEWIRSGKLQVKAYPAQNLHAKLYIMTFAEDDRDRGRVITGSSNFSQSGFVDQLEFNVELKTAADYHFALDKFNELWSDAVDVSERYVTTIETRTWLASISPYELYLKFLYEYFRDKINSDQRALDLQYLPEKFLSLEYQREAVEDAKSKLDAYGGVFISDVVGLGKTYISAMLAQQLDGRHLVIASPVLLDRENPGSWPNVFDDFRVPAQFVSRGKLDRLASFDLTKYQNVFIDEAHTFRSDSTATYEDLTQICRGKRVVLVTATPLNNSSRDILSQIKLFQRARRSTIPNVPDLDHFFSHLDRRLRPLDRMRDHDLYIQTVRENARLVRDRILKHLMVRRTRSEIEEYFGDDLRRQHLRFPEVHAPQPIYYELSAHEDAVFTETVELITRSFRYSRYTPLLYYQGQRVSQAETLSQRNMGKFMKILLVKRLESSFHAFRNSLARFIWSYEHFLAEYDKGNVYVSKKYSAKVYEYFETGNDGAIQRLVDLDRAQRYDASDFSPDLGSDLRSDLATLRTVAAKWKTVQRDPKLLRFLDVLKTDPILASNKVLIFTESKETASFLGEHLGGQARGVLTYTGASTAAIRDHVIANFDANARHPRDEYRLLVATDVLAEGVNLARSNAVVNYDLPWNPTRLMQRVGRVNRVDTKFRDIYTYNCFPTKQANNEIQLREAAEAKISAFIQMLGADARLLTEGEDIESFSLFDRLMSKASVTGDEGAGESELKYLQIIRAIRDSQPLLFEKIKRLPRKARAGRVGATPGAKVMTYFRKGALQKFYLGSSTTARELDFFTAAGLFEASPETLSYVVGSDYYGALTANRNQFALEMSEALPDLSLAAGGRDSAARLLRLLRSKELRTWPAFSDVDEEFIRHLTRVVQDNSLPSQTSKRVMKAVDGVVDPMQVLAHLRKHIPIGLLAEVPASSTAVTEGPIEVVLSEYFLAVPHVG
jgi:hypothetical protein